MIPGYEGGWVWFGREGMGFGSVLARKCEPARTVHERGMVIASVQAGRRTTTTTHCRRRGKRRGWDRKRENQPTRRVHARVTHLEKLGRTPIDTHSLALVEIPFEVLFRDTLGVTRVDESVEDVGDHVEFGDGHLDLYWRESGATWHGQVVVVARRTGGDEM